MRNTTQRPKCFGAYISLEAAERSCVDCPAETACLEATGRTSRALDVQVGGGHYKDMAIQPAEFIHKNGIGFIEGSVIKYVSRWRKKNGIEDLRKARHFLDMLIEMEEAQAK